MTGAVAKVAADKRAFVAKEVWDLFVGFEQTHGTMETMTAVERRRQVALGRDLPSSTQPFSSLKSTETTQLVPQKVLTLC